MEQRTYIYRNPTEDEFSGVGKRPPVKIDGNFPYTHKNPLWKCCAAIVRRVCMTPFAYLYCKMKFSIRIEGREKLRDCKNGGYYLFGNHTQVPGDGFIQAITAFPKKTAVVVNPDNVALPGTRNLMQMLGAVPTPTALSGFPGFRGALRESMEKGGAVVIYPEAHIWPYYTGIRPFSSISFRYAAEDGAPCFAFTVTYRKRNRRPPGITVQVDGPFISGEKTVRARAEDLRNQVYAAMQNRAGIPENYAYHTYIDGRTQYGDAERKIQ